MSGSGPPAAGVRNDLDWIRRRHRPRAVEPDQPQAQSRGTSQPITFQRPPSRARPAQPAPAPVSGSLDLSSPEPSPGSPAAPPQPTAARQGAAARDAAVRRTDPARPTVLTPAEPVVRLTRLQSGIGTLTFEAACSRAVGDLHLACAYRLSNGGTGLAANRDGLSLAPRNVQPPVLRVHRDQFETVTVDCRRVRDIDRLLIIGYSPSGSELAWGGTLLVTTYGKARIEAPMDGPASAEAVGLVTCYQVDGELVVRAEPRESTANLREACLTFGFDQITWLDPNTPIT